MPTTATSLDSTLFTIVLATLAVGLPVFFVLAIRFFWERSLALGRSKELEKLTWQLHRIASALEHQMNLSFPAVQPGTEEPHDIAFLQKPASPPRSAPAPDPSAVAAPPAAPVAPAATNAVPPAATPSPAAAATNEPPQPSPAADSPEQSDESAGFPPLVPHDPAKPQRHGGVNSMFGF